jgi:23S rRNA maturation-related 3'-5' exoribonuclease YhaM
MTQKFNEISQLQNMQQGDSISLKVLIIEAKSLPKKDQTLYISLNVQDSSGKMDFPVWDNYDVRVKALVSGKVIGVTGSLSFYENKPQIKDPTFVLMENASPQECLPKYDIPDELVKYFNRKIENLSEPYKRFAIKATGAFGDSQEMWTMFTSAPAAQSHHQNKIGGLFVHTVGVMKNIESMLENYAVNPFFINASQHINKDRVILKAILHDIGKVWEYEWQTGIKRREVARGHILTGCSYIDKINDSLKAFSEAEVDNICASILSHHGKYEQYGRAEMKTPEDFMLHLADMIDSQIVGAVEGAK